MRMVPARGRMAGHPEVRGKTWKPVTHVSFAASFRMKLGSTQRSGRLARILTAKSQERSGAITQQTSGRDIACATVRRRGHDKQTTLGQKNDTPRNVATVRYCFAAIRR